MSFILTDKANDENDLQINAWNWRRVLMLLEQYQAFDADKLELMGISGACPFFCYCQKNEVAVYKA